MTTDMTLPKDQDLTAAYPHFFVEKVLSLHHWTDRLFSFSITRPQSFRFRSGEFVMIGLPEWDEAGVPKKPLLRAYSLASPHFAETLDFFSIKVADGPLTSRLQKISVGDAIVMGKKPTGTLVLDALKPGKRLFLFATGTGLAPYLSVARDPETYEKFDQVIVAHGVRRVGELAYRSFWETSIFQDELIGDLAQGRLSYYPAVTREVFTRQGRFPDLIRSGQFFKDLGLSEQGFDPIQDRAMLCGSMAMIKDMAAVFDSFGLCEGSNADPGDYVLERAFVG